MVNYNGELLSENLKISIENRGFKFGDAIFETVKVQQNKVIFLEDHYFRLMASMRMLRMKIPMSFTLEFLEQEILRLIRAQEKAVSYRVRLTVYRKEGGLYAPKTNEIDYLIEAKAYTYQTKLSYEIDLYKDFYNYSGLLSTIKTTNRMLNTLASVFAEENDLDNCVLLNEKKGVVEVTNGNIFIIKGSTVKTPALTEGALKGVVRKKVIAMLDKKEEFTLEEGIISPFELQKADEIFITNAIVGIQPVTKYRKKKFSTTISEKLQKNLRVLEITES
ncbi:probable aminotransferase [Tenacibaculum maritimum]|uniref:aminotransferase class IV n=1 Tax=Tenacibaculum maritimum TaxID=107401 RepID=UPI0012E5F593|nr:aminotransferase class IV [Tenacibaculum maritimum]CAA0169419.1 probable aminotransferase [Tenacibaculum maritimum]CAA0182055.1 probable aminotransferase [Tenacibaculum maritimum]CAA0259138.1 probable aminotransferase [Tenacibaculum maritimum]